MPVREAHSVQPRTGVWQFRHADGAPGKAAVLRFTHANTPQGTVLAHVSDECAVVLPDHGGLNTAITSQWLAGIPGFALVVADRHQGGGVSIGVKRQEDSSRWQHGRFA